VLYRDLAPLNPEPTQEDLRRGRTAIVEEFYRLGEAFYHYEPDGTPRPGVYDAGHHGTNMVTDLDGDEATTLDAGPAGVVSLERDRSFRGAGGGLRFGQVPGQHGELASFPAAAGAQAAGRAGAATADGEGGHDGVLAPLGTRSPGH
jgi:hypothetical protein